jgi:hypothetical protein
MPASYVRAAFITVKVSFPSDGFPDMVSTFDAGSHGRDQAEKWATMVLSNRPELDGHKATGVQLIAHDAHPTRDDCGTGMILRSDTWED